MSAPTSLKEVYVDELRDLWSANVQMQKVLGSIGGKASDAKLKELIQTSVSGIGKHNEMVKQVIQANGGESEAEHCKGMEGLVKEASKHVLEEGVDDANLRDLVIISQYQRMSHYGLAGFGTAAAYAKALGRSDDEATLKKIVSDIYKTDEFSSRLAEGLERAAPQG